MGEFAGNVPYTEPTEVVCQYISGTAVQISEHTVQVVGWTDIVHLHQGEPDERRITVRIIMPLDAGSKLRTALSNNLPKTV